MSSIEKAIGLVNVPPGDRVKNNASLLAQTEIPKEDYLLAMNLHKSKMAKRAMDANRRVNRYAAIKKIQQPLLEHYEDVDWYERDTQFDF